MKKFVNRHAGSLSDYYAVTNCNYFLAQVARVVSFSAESPGFVAMPFMDLTENAQLTLKFRTNRPNGLIFYTSNEDHSKFLALGLRGGRLFLQARPGGRVETEGTYDDGRWHYVTASSYSNRLRLDIDDALVVSTVLQLSSSKVLVLLDCHCGFA